MASFNTLKERGLRYALGSALRKSGYDIEYFAARKRLKPEPFKKYPIKVDDVNMVLDFGEVQIGKTVWQRIEGVREPETTAIIRSLLRPGNKVLELGSCYGYFTLLMSASVGTSGKVLAVEGLPRYFDILCRNIRNNKAENVEVLNYFVGSKGGSIRFKKGSNGYKEFSEYNLNKPHENSNDSTEVEVINLAEFLTQKNFIPDYIFMDIEGFELDALEQLAAEFLRQHSTTIIFEHHEKFYTEGKGLDYIRHVLRDCNYETRLIYGNVVAFKK